MPFSLTGGTWFNNSVLISSINWQSTGGCSCKWNSIGRKTDGPPSPHRCYPALESLCSVFLLSNQVECFSGTWVIQLKITWDLQADKCSGSGGDRLSSFLQPSSLKLRLTPQSLWTAALYFQGCEEFSFSTVLRLQALFGIIIIAVECLAWTSSSGSAKKRKVISRFKCTSVLW